jgi:hypothetical protein
MTDTTTESAAVDTVTLKLTSRPDVMMLIARIVDFVREHPTVPEIRSASVTFEASSRAELDGVAGDFGQKPPRNSNHYRGAQFAEYPGPAGDPFLQMIVAHHEDRG